MPKKRTPTPMETQFDGWRHDPMTMASSPSKKSKWPSRPPSPDVSQGNSETSRRSSLEEQRRQMETIRKRKDP
jgi:hypothetical protein